jgi:hypothetical protein
MQQYVVVLLKKAVCRPVALVCLLSTCSVFPPEAIINLMRAGPYPPKWEFLVRRVRWCSRSQAHTRFA